MSHKTHYKTFSQADLTELEKEINSFLHDLYKDEKIDDVKVANISTMNVSNVFIAAMTYSYAKAKTPETLVVPAAPAS